MEDIIEDICSTLYYNRSIVKTEMLPLSICWGVHSFINVGERETWGVWKKTVNIQCTSVVGPLWLMLSALVMLLRATHWSAKSSSSSLWAVEP